MTMLLRCSAARPRVAGRWIGGTSPTEMVPPPARPSAMLAIIGPRGQGAEPTRVEAAGVALSGHRAVFVGGDGAFYYCQLDLTARLCVGITTGAAAKGAPATAQTGGLIDEPSWSWNPALPVWISTDGLLTQIVPTAGALCQIGTPAGPTALRINPQFFALLP